MRRWLRSTRPGPSAMPSCVADASVLASAVGESGEPGRRIRARLRPYRLAAPDYAVVEVVSVIRGRWLGRALSGDDAERALSDFADLTIDRFDSGVLMARVWELRDSLTAYDAGYVALAEALACPLITADRRLARAPGIRCAVETV